MQLLSHTHAIFFLIGFAALMLGVTWFFGRRIESGSVDGFIVAGRNVPWWLLGPSISASWTWAIALMVSVQLAYENGFAGSFWFTVPNIAAVLVYIWLGPRLRQRLPKGYSLPEWMFARTGSTGVVLIYLIVFGFYQIMAVTVQIYAGSQLMSVATGISALTLMPTFLVITLSYVLISGLRASIVTDFVQLLLILTIGLITVTVVVSATGAPLDFVGVSGNGGLNPFEPGFMLTTGLITTIGLLSGSVGDQQMWQRALASRSADVRKGFVFGALLFALIPIGLSFIGFAGAAIQPDLSVEVGMDGGLIGFVIVKDLVAPVLATLFLLVLLAGLSSTLDSGLMAWVSLTALTKQRPWTENGQKHLPGEVLSVSNSRLQMIVLGAIGLALAYMVELIPGFGLKYLWWFMNTMGASIVVPTVLSLTWNQLSAKGVIVGSTLNLIFGLPVVAYASATANDVVLVVAYIAIILASLISCVAFKRG